MPDTRNPTLNYHGYPLTNSKPHQPDDQKENKRMKPNAYQEIENKNKNQKKK
jgi:hypothetical protein